MADETTATETAATAAKSNGKKKSSKKAAAKGSTKRHSPATKKAAAKKGPAKARKIGEPRPGSKSEAIINLLKRASGATIDQLMEKTEWQKHSVRGFLCTLAKTHKVTSDKAEGKDRVYRIK